MKTLAAVIAGLLLSITTFVAGLFVAFMFFTAGREPHRLDNQDAAVLWTSKPVSVSRDPSSFERLPARTALAEKQERPAEKDTLAAEAAADNNRIDPVTTSAVEAAFPEEEVRPEQNIAHVDWCLRRYQSYDPDSDTYQPYSGRRRPCISPYLERGSASQGTIAGAGETRDDDGYAREDTDGQAVLEQAGLNDGQYLDEEHIRSCMRRYRSYDLQSNTYQPYDGGPRRQCQ